MNNDENKTAPVNPDKARAEREKAHQAKLDKAGKAADIANKAEAEAREGK